MNSIKNYFQSPTKKVSSKDEKIHEITTNSIDETNLIISNMKTVIKLEKKHKKHKKKRNAENETEISNISNILNNSLNIISPNMSLQDVNKSVEIEPKIENGKKLDKSYEVSQKPVKKDSKTEKRIKEDSTKKLKKIRRNNKVEEEVVEEKLAKPAQKTILSPKKNVFQIMMSARSRPIGSNSPGRQTEGSEVISSPETKDPAKVKRRLILEKWAEQKGSIKNKLKDEAQEEYVNQKMEERAKNLKKLLTTDNKSKKSKKIKKRTPKILIVEEDSIDSEVQEDIHEIADKLRHHKRLNSADLKEPVKTPPAKDSDNEFLIKLSSPTKKKDSLLGYFPVVQESPTNENSNDGSLVDVFILAETEPVTENIISSGRPRRSCTEVRKSYIFDMSPEKLNTKKRNKRILNSSPASSDEEESSSINKSKGKLKTLKKAKLIIVEDDVIECDSSLSCNDTPIKKNLKLAPLFVKTVPKPAIDPKILQARQEFLMSGIPDKLRAEIDKQKIYEESYEFNLNLFPLVSHVRQLVDLSFKLDDRIEIELIKNDSDEREEECCDDNMERISFGCFTDCTTSDSLKSSNLNDLKIYKIQPAIGKDKLTNLLKQLKLSFNEFPVNRCYTALKSIQTDYSEKLKSNEKSQYLNGDQLFTEKYKPKLSEEIFLNKSPIEQLKNFLSSWTVERKSEYDSADDFEYANDSTNSNLSSICNSIVLFGPNGTGKTNAVFALANEMNFKVLEINSGSKRTGKKLLQELQEATQSHNLRGKKDNGGSELLKKAVQESCSHIIRSDSQDDSSNETNDKKRLALILIEDADIVFEQDFGFIDAINQIVQTSKRPIVLIANNRNCSHLLKLIGQNSIEFFKINPEKTSNYLSLLGLAENLYIDRNEITKLLKFNQNDLRKTILELQFFIQSGGDRLKSRSTSKQIYKHNKIFNLYTQSYYKIPYPIDFNSLWMNFGKMKIKRTDDLHLDFYENISKSLYYGNLKKENDNLLNNSTDDIVHEIVEKSLKLIDSDFNYDRLINFNYNERDILYDRLTIPMLNKSKSAISLDYEPYLRSICRVERDRQCSDRKSTRFYHYLRNLVSFNTCSSEIYDSYANTFEMSEIEFSLNE